MYGQNIPESIGKGRTARMRHAGGEIYGSATMTFEDVRNAAIMAAKIHAKEFGSLTYPWGYCIVVYGQGVTSTSFM